MKKKLAVIIVSISICASIVGAVFYFNENDLVFGILIVDREILVGDNITLHYEIKNGMFAPSVSDVYLHIWVYDLRDTNFQEGVLHYFIPSYNLSDVQVISAYLLDPGEYIVHADLLYRTDTNHYKHLAMEFEIYPMEGR